MDAVRAADAARVLEELLSPERDLGFPYWVNGWRALGPAGTRGSVVVVREVVNSEGEGFRIVSDSGIWSKYRLYRSGERQVHVYESATDDQLDTDLGELADLAAKWSQESILVRNYDRNEW
ncbi:hypothetical protein [Nocardia sp. NPDC051570]|uniref:hypothetical protein n=1 Tax=Nocardia sp. NPDC051570 TaxID=3364324 RepID=UPI003799B1B7